MSGSSGDGSTSIPHVVFVAASADTFTARAVEALARIPRDLPPWALIGGVAVAVNLSGFHRTTGDLDAVSLDGEAAIALLVASGGTRAGDSVMLTADDSSVTFDIIDVSEGSPDHGPFLAHRFALDTAVPRRIGVSIGAAQPAMSVVVLVATPAAVVTMKLHAIDGRRAARPDKRSGDLYDIIRLVGAFGPAQLAVDLRTAASPVLLASTQRWCHEYFVTEATRSLRLLKIDSRSVVSDVDRVDIGLVAEFSSLLAE